MSEEIKSGNEILQEFIEEIKTNDQLDKETVNAVVELFESGKLSDRNLTNELSELRDNKNDGKAQ